ncbi:MAG: hypothetical protein R3C62_23785 [Chloroflexota bacterium]
MSPRRLARAVPKTAVFGNTGARRPGEKAISIANFNPGHPAPTTGFG